jgi:hypothetical protein
VVHQGRQGYLCKFWEPFCGHSSSSQEFVTVGINLGIVWSLFYYWTSKLINSLLFPSFPNSHHLRANFPNYKGPQIQMSRKIRHNKTWPILLLPVEETRAVMLTSPASRHAYFKRLSNSETQYLFWRSKRLSNSEIQDLFCIYLKFTPQNIRRLISCDNVWSVWDCKVFDS